LGLKTNFQAQKLSAIQTCLKSGSFPAALSRLIEIAPFSPTVQFLFGVYFPGGLARTTIK
jgi:hypothetical protein